MEMARTTAIIIGVGEGPEIDRLNLIHLTYAEPGAETIAGYAHNLGYDPVIRLIGPDATLNRVVNAIDTVSRLRPPLDTVLIVFSGHGHQQDSGGLCEYQGMDEHWCLRNGLLVDDRLLLLTQQFASTTRLLIVADCCFAAEGSGAHGELFRKLMRRTSNLLADLFAGPRRRWRREIEDARAALRRELLVGNCRPPDARWLLFGSSGSTPAETGKFMEAFLRAWNEPGARTSFRTFSKELRRLGGAPVVLAQDSALLDDPAFVP
jgi:hypothetical protein